ncbi:MAG TPA: class I SAM-dependent methyltransferase [Chitinivibrionales bacterium]|nr:class I SAM-dependent methyltransferase [Chitinivibrionales bacterium]
MNDTRSHGTSSDYGDSYAQYQLKPRGALRAIVRQCYLHRLLSEVEGPALDVGCGTGELLSRLADGSLGLEVNEAAVAHCQKIGLPVRLYDPDIDKYSFRSLHPGRFRTCVLSHVLEHMPDPAAALREIFSSCARLAIRRIVVVVPGRKGFAFDASHRIFVTEAYLKSNGLWPPDRFRVAKRYFFPGNFSWLGRFFTHHEMHVIYEAC